MCDTAFYSISVKCLEKCFRLIDCIYCTEQKVLGKDGSKNQHNVDTITSRQHNLISVN